MFLSPHSFNVMPGLDPGIQKAVHAAPTDWIAGSSPAMTIKKFLRH
jgi:hypothetical protein